MASLCKRLGFTLVKPAARSEPPADSAGGLFVHIMNGAARKGLCCSHSPGTVVSPFPPARDTPQESKRVRIGTETEPGF